METYQTFRKGSSEADESGCFFEENGRNIINCDLSSIGHSSSKSTLSDQKKSSLFRFSLTDRTNTGRKNREKSMTTHSKTMKTVSE